MRKCAWFKNISFKNSNSKCNRCKGFDRNCKQYLPPDDVEERIERFNDEYLHKPLSIRFAQ